MLVQHILDTLKLKTQCMPSSGHDRCDLGTGGRALPEKGHVPFVYEIRENTLSRWTRTISVDNEYW